jgi:hypothetical protein
VSVFRRKVAEVINPALFEGPGSINRHFARSGLVADPLRYLQIAYDGRTGWAIAPEIVHVDPSLAKLIRPIENGFASLFLHAMITEAIYYFGRTSPSSDFPRALSRPTALRFGQTIEKIERCLLRLANEVVVAEGDETLSFHVQILPLERVCRLVGISATTGGARGSQLDQFSRAAILNRTEWGADMDQWFVGVDEVRWKIEIPAASAHERLARQRWLDRAPTEPVYGPRQTIRRRLRDAWRAIVKTRAEQ